MRVRGAARGRYMARAPPGPRVPGTHLTHSCPQCAVWYQEGGQLGSRFLQSELLYPGLHVGLVTGCVCAQTCPGPPPDWASPRASWADSQLSRWRPQWPALGPVWKEHGLLMEYLGEGRLVNRVPESPPSLPPVLISDTWRLHTVFIGSQENTI